MDLPSSDESEEEVENKHRGADGEEDEVPLEQKIKVRAEPCIPAQSGAGLTVGHAGAVAPEPVVRRSCIGECGRSLAHGWLRKGSSSAKQASPSVQPGSAYVPWCWSDATPLAGHKAAAKA